jgi:hypothetical protein
LKNTNYNVNIPNSNTEPDHASEKLQIQKTYTGNGK